MLNQSRGEVAYTVVDLDQKVPDATYSRIGRRISSKGDLIGYG